MAKSTISSLQINHDLKHEELEWKIERVGWILMALTLLAAMAGLLGTGALSRAKAGQDDLLSVEYSRFARYQAPDSLRVRVNPGVSRNGKVRLWLDSEYIQNIELKHIDPEPERVEAGPERFTYTFNFSGDGQATTLIFHFEPNNFGRMSAAIGLGDGPPLAFTQFIYP
jgi:hypothetical protein